MTLYANISHSLFFYVYTLLLPIVFYYCFFFFFQAEDGIRDAQESRGLGDVYKRQDHSFLKGSGIFDRRLKVLISSALSPVHLNRKYAGRELILEKGVTSISFKPLHPNIKYISKSVT
eukprot:TRINITY_DN10013_c0_g1_i1.p1 TRINITY_DN10013_c0_g1~~TRINITY_DN10013_c0_g1_i1.p1  ORF type:complete len:118 (-),score=10.16 TRINITY_DN10013_c0_g1_i1:25-378(-)